MRKNEREDMAEAMDHILKLLDTVDRTTEQMQTVLMIRDPSSTAAADAYEGLRKQVIATSTERRQHLLQLAEFETALRNGADAATLRSLIDGWMEQAGLIRRYKVNGDDIDHLFELTEDTGPDFKVTSPAYVDVKTQSIIRMGRGRKVASAAAAGRSEPRRQRAPDEAGRDGTAASARDGSASTERDGTTS